MEFRLPEIGEGVYEAEFLNWLVKPGDTVKSGQNLMEVMTDKATMEVPAPFAGTITELRASPGQKIKVGDVLLTYTPAGATQPEADAARPAASTNDRLSHARPTSQPVAAIAVSASHAMARNCGDHDQVLRAVGATPSAAWVVSGGAALFVGAWSLWRSTVSAPFSSLCSSSCATCLRNLPKLLAVLLAPLPVYRCDILCCSRVVHHK